MIITKGKEMERIIFIVYWNYEFSTLITFFVVPFTCISFFGFSWVGCREDFGELNYVGMNYNSEQKKRRGKKKIQKEMLKDASPL